MSTFKPFFNHCKLSPEGDKMCPWAIARDDGDTWCSMVEGWYHDLSIKHHKKCFLKLKSRDKLSFRNKMMRLDEEKENSKSKKTQNGMRKNIRK